MHSLFIAILFIINYVILNAILSIKIVSLSFFKCNIVSLNHGNIARSLLYDGSCKGTFRLSRHYIGRKPFIWYLHINNFLKEIGWQTIKVLLLPVALNAKQNVRKHTFCTFSTNSRYKMEWWNNFALFLFLITIYSRRSNRLVTSVHLVL